MRIVHDWKGLADIDRGAAVALGNFDGVHRGHQQVIALAAKAAGQLKAPLGVISFDPHPRRIFQPDSPSFRLMQPDQQARALAGLGVDISYVLPFTQEFAEMTDREFVVEVLHKGLGVRDVAVGFDISFGKGRTGSPETMARYGEELGFGVSVAQAVGEGNSKFSSTAVREVLRDGHPEIAASILGRPFAIEGVVERGRQLGRTLGYPTANVDLRDYVLPRFGVYATRTRLPDGRE
ncbi:MAG: bifunctional riboflavin kinase/FMN adenylyltransferase, partial [Phenylobacterium sp.]|nr:bifunctional riboflavin kinase/FMN adenylyltransferase [Phenylobacterium sp.]